MHKKNEKQLVYLESVLVLIDRGPEGDVIYPKHLDTLSKADSESKWCYNIPGPNYYTHL